jgi:hypothetical protein
VVPSFIHSVGYSAHKQHAINTSTHNLTY